MDKRGEKITHYRWRNRPSTSTAFHQ